MTHSDDRLKSTNSASNPEIDIETVYTTVESKFEQTDWLTVIGNLRQGNRQLLEQIAQLEQALAGSQQALHRCKEEKQAHEIAILQQQDELRANQERVNGLFQQLENAHQIGQRQQNLVETLSQQLEITQAIVPALEAENNELRQQNHHQAQQLTKAEHIIRELHRRLLEGQSPDRIKVNPDNEPIVEEIERELVAATVEAQGVNTSAITLQSGGERPTFNTSISEIEVTDKISLDDSPLPQPQPPAKPKYAPVKASSPSEVEAQPTTTPAGKKLKIDLPKFPKRKDE
jgi:chromosome segregation ATPase